MSDPFSKDGNGPKDERPNFTKVDDAAPQITVLYAGSAYHVDRKDGAAASYYLSQAKIGTGFLGSGLGSGKTVSYEDANGNLHRVGMTGTVPADAVKLVVNTKVRNG